MLVLLVVLTASAYAESWGGITQREIIGYSVQGREISVERIGNGPIDLLIVGGIHGGYEANSVVLAREVADYFRMRPLELGSSVTLHVIDLMNPDGLYLIAGDADPSSFPFMDVERVPGRFNANGVDLNRNWDADWKTVSYWGTREVNTGTGPFSEPETRAVRDYFTRIEPEGSIFFQSAGAFLWYSGAEYGWEPAGELAGVYAEASGYRLAAPRIRDPEEPRRFDITGSSDDWFYSIGHRNITVELTNHFDTEFERNLMGVKAVISRQIQESMVE